MQQAFEKKLVRFDEDASVSAELLSRSLRSFSVDGELLTRSSIVITERQRGGFEPMAHLRQCADSSCSYTMVNSQVIPFSFSQDSLAGIAGEELQNREEELYEAHNRELVVEPLRKVIFSKSVSIAPQNLRRLQPKIVLDDRCFSRDED